jgi:hypothetical protein
MRRKKSFTCLWRKFLLDPDLFPLRPVLSEVKEVNSTCQLPSPTAPSRLLRLTRLSLAMTRRCHCEHLHFYHYEPSFLSLRAPFFLSLRAKRGNLWYLEARINLATKFPMRRGGACPRPFSCSYCVCALVGDKVVPKIQAKMAQSLASI